MGVKIANFILRNTTYNLNREEIAKLNTNIKLKKLRQNTQKLNVVR